MKKIKVGLLGATGRMGQEIAKILEATPNAQLILSVGSKTKIDVKKSKEVDVWIDFSIPEALASSLAQAVKNKQAYICGTTGLSEKQKKSLEKAAALIPVLWSSNMSLGVAVLNEALNVFSSLQQFDFQIEEIHHIHKKDRPSGTALTLQENLEKAVGRKLPSPVSIRGGGVFGVHKVFALSPEEMITFEHTALNRSVFAKGAVQAACWIVGRKPGFYTMKDCLFGK